MKIELSYQTHHLPAPYAFSAVFHIQLKESRVSVDFHQTYLGRDDVSEEEILAEGFSLEDDFSWTGTLGSNWTRPIKAVVQSNKLDQPNEDFYLHVSSEEANGYPDLASDLIIQELLQAVLEAALREAPLFVHFFEKKLKTHISWEFSNRKVLINNKEWNWDESYELMKILYSFDFEELKPSKKPVNQSVSFDEKKWFVLNKETSLWKVFDRAMSGIK